MKLTEDMEELGGTIHDAIQKMVNVMFREELDDDQITEIVRSLSLSDVLSLDAAYTKNDKAAVQQILGPLPQLEYNMGGGGATSSASARPTTAGAAKKTAAAAAPTKDKPASNYSGGNQNVAPKISNTTINNNNADEEELDEEHTDWVLCSDKDKAVKEDVELAEMTAWLKRRAGIDT